MADFLDYMDSVALREHLQKIGYALSPLERAYVVRHSRKRSLTEKVAAMRELLNTSPDFELPVDEYTDGNNRFHVLLREWIDTKQKYLDESVLYTPLKNIAYDIFPYLKQLLFK